MDEAGPARAGVQIGIDVRALDPSRAMPPGDLLALAVALDADAVSIDAGSLERHLGAPTVPANAQPLPANSFELGLTPLDEEVLQDEIDTAARTVAARLGRWRVGVPMADIEAIGRRYAEAGIAIASVYWPEIAQWSDGEADYAWRVTKAVGAHAAVVPMALGAPRRLGPFAERHGLWLSVEGQFVTSSADFEVAAGQGVLVGLAVDTAHWTAGHHGPLLPFLERHADRVTHLRVRDCTASGAGAPMGQGVAPVREVIQAMRDHGWTFPAIVAADARDLGAGTRDALEQALAYCRSCLVE